MYWVVAAILNWPIKPLNIKFCIILLYNYNIAFIQLYFIKLKACLVLRLAFCKVPDVLETIVLPIVMAYSNESFLTVSSAGF